MGPTDSSSEVATVGLWVTAAHPGQASTWITISFQIFTRANSLNITVSSEAAPERDPCRPSSSPQGGRGWHGSVEALKLAPWYYWPYFPKWVLTGGHNLYIQYSHDNDTATRKAHESKGLSKDQPHDVYYPAPPDYVGGEKTGQGQGNHVFKARCRID